MLNRRAWLRTYGAAAVFGSAGGAGAFSASADRLDAAGFLLNDLLVSWKDIARKLVDMAEDFPEDKYDWRPAPGMRSFAEQLLHAAGFVTYVAANAKGLHPSVEDPARANFGSKAAIASYVKQVYAEGAKTISALSDTKLHATIDVGLRSRPQASLYGLWDTVVEHSGEHYGQLVAYYRLNNLVPPESRPK
jgi:DinB superfamily